MSAFDNGAHAPMMDKRVISSKPSGTGGFVDTQNHARDMSPLMRNINLDLSQNSFHTRPDASTNNLLTTSRHAVIYPHMSDRELGHNSGIISSPIFAQTMTSGMINQDKSRLRSSSNNVLQGNRHLVADLDSKM
jgi:hypothetical protein